MDVDPKIVDWAFKGLVSLISIYGIRIFSLLYSSIAELNVKMAVVVEQVSAHDKRISKLEDN